MKKSWWIVLLAIAIAEVALWELFIPHRRYYQGATDEFRFVERSHMGNKLYGMQKEYLDGDWKDVIPTKYSDLRFHGGMIVADFNDGSSTYLYSRAGEPILKDVNIKDFNYYRNNNAYNFYKRRFALGDYVVADTEDGRYALFVDDCLETFGWISIEKFGPYKDFIPGCSGYMFQDLQSKKWGYHIYKYDRMSVAYPPECVENYILLDPEYDQVIEYYNPTSVSSGLIFAYKDGLWSAFDKQGKKVDYPQELLNNILDLDPQPKVRENPRYTPFRYGIEDASVAFYGY